MIYSILITVFIIVVLVISMSKSSKTNQRDSLPKDLRMFLDKADDAYILTHETIDIGYFSRYATSNVCNQVIDDINKKPPKLFGTKNYRRRVWNIISQEKDKILVRKELTHKHIEVKKGIKVALGDDMIECWKVALTPNGFLVEELS